jgi:hypothetical protein
MKDTLTTIIVLIVVFFAGWFVNGQRTDQQWRDRIGSAPFVYAYHERYIEIPVPAMPLPIPAPPVKDPTGIAAAIDSMHAIYKDSLAVMHELARKFTGEHKDSNMYLKATADPVRRMIIIDTLYFKPVRCDSVVVTKVVIDPAPPGVTAQTAVCVAIGAAAGASIADETGAAIGAVAGLGLDWLIGKLF